jgi:hypothetical protein
MNITNPKRTIERTLRAVIFLMINKLFFSLNVTFIQHIYCKSLGQIHIPFFFTTVISNIIRFCYISVDIIKLLSGARPVNFTKGDLIIKASQKAMFSKLKTRTPKLFILVNNLLNLDLHFISFV